MKPLARLALGCLLLVAPAAAQDDSQPAFSLASSQIFTTKDSPAIHLSFRQLSHVDFRVYRVKDVTAFFASLQDPHVLGGPEPLVPEEETWLERISRWKASWRSSIRQFARRQFSLEYRARRRERLDQQEVQLRRVVGKATFAQVPLLNDSQVVTTWREMLPPVREADARRIPLELEEPGVYVVEAVFNRLRAYTIVVITDLGLITKTAPGQVLAFAADRMSGEPRAGCQVDAVADRKVVASGTTGDDGTFLAALEGVQSESVIALARCGSEVTVADPGGWFLRDPLRELVGFVYTDKPVYRPGHIAHVKAVLRWRGRGGLAPFDRPAVEIAVSDPLNKVVFRETRPVDEFGAAFASFAVPRTAALGDYSVQISSEGDQAGGSFEVQEYRRPEFEVTVSAPDRFIVQGGTVTATIRAKYYFGQPVSGGAVKYVLYRGYYASPLRWTDEVEDESGWYGYGGMQVGEYAARLDSDGEATVPVPVALLGEGEVGQDYSLRIEARVTDQSDRECSGSATIYGTYGPFLVSASTDEYVLRPGAVSTVSLRAIDYLGAPRPGLTVCVVLERLAAGQYGWRHDAKTIEVSRAEVTTDAEGRASWAATLPSEPGSYRFKATVALEDRTIADAAWVWVPGRSAGAEVDEGDRYLELIADRREYQPGDVARLVVRGEAPDAAALVTKEGRQITWHRLQRLEAGAVIEVPVGDDDLGDTYVNFVFLKDDRLYRAERRLRVPATSRQITLAIEAAHAVARPRQSGLFRIRATDAQGQPVRAQLSVAVIDEAVYGVKADATPDPLRQFYRLEYSRVGTSFSREYSFVGYSGREQILLAARRRPFTLADFKAERAPRPQVRREFPDAILWIADLVTGDDGTAEIAVPYPDALTTWRLTARAVTRDTQVGGAVARTTTTKDLILRLVTPRFLTEGDEVAVPVIVHNYLPGAQGVALTVSAAGVSTVTEGARTLTVASGGEERTDWRFRADRTGSATFTGAAVAPDDSDALELSVPVLPYGLKKEVGASGSLTDASASQHRVEVTIPERSNPGARSIQVALAPSLGGVLIGALDFLTSFPYGCTEQTLSSFVPNLVVARALQQLQIRPPERLAALDRQVTEGLRRLYDYQHDDGGWGWWKTDPNHPFMTAYALSGLLDAAAGGYDVDRWRMRRAAGALAGLYARYPRATPDLKAYLIHVLARADAAGIEAARPEGVAYALPDAVESAWASRDRMTAYGRALLLMTLDQRKDRRGDELARTLLAEARTREQLTWWAVDHDPLLNDFADSSVEATALALMALVARTPHDPALERAVRWLILNRSGAYWWSTKQTAMALHGLVEYLKARREQPAAFTVDVFVNGQAAGSHTFTPQSWTAPDPVIVSSAARAGQNEIRIVRRGGAALYWSATATYYDDAEALEASGSRSLALARQYFSLTPVTRGGRTVYRESPFSGAAQPGDVVLVRLTAAGAHDWRYLVIEDPIPAGAEAIRQQDLYELERHPRGWSFSHREYRDDRVVMFQQDFEGGRYEFTYLLKITTPGTFRAMPGRIAPMYVPGVSASTRAQGLTVRLPGAPE
jgi:hypothetical protein